MILTRAQVGGSYLESFDRGGREGSWLEFPACYHTRRTQRMLARSNCPSPRSPRTLEH
jgi:hypothetical protein